MVNLFNRSAHRDGEPLPIPPPADRVDRVSAERRAEDEVFATRVGLARLDLDLPEPALLGRRHTHFSDADLVALRQSLLPLLRQLLAEPGAVAMFCPAGIGRHANHIATRNVVIEVLPELAARGVRVMFYEDLHYASSLSARRRGLDVLRKALPGRRMVRRTGSVDRALKLELINLYPSQLKLPVTSLKRFSPAALWPFGAHEAVWELLPD